MRDWQATLWPASFGGLAFFVEKTKDQFGKKVVVHEFPRLNSPYVEDLGSKANHFEVVAYFADDAADVEAGALKSMLLAFGPQTLVLPDEGPISCMFMDGTRDHERDRLGWSAFSLKFVATGASTALISTASLAQAVFDAVGSLATAAGSLMGNLGL
jgi:prophage DNA circulation protein